MHLIVTIGEGIYYVLFYMPIMMVIEPVIHLYLAVCLMAIARKTGTPGRWLAWIPIGNLVLMCRIARRPGWWALLILFPLVNLIVIPLVWIDIAKARGKPAWLGLLVIVPLVNLVALFVVAFGAGVPLATAAIPTHPDGPVSPPKSSGDWPLVATAVAMIILALAGIGALFWSEPRTVFTAISDTDDGVVPYQPGLVQPTPSPSSPTPER